MGISSQHYGWCVTPFSHLSWLPFDSTPADPDNGYTELGPEPIVMPLRTSTRPRRPDGVAMLMLVASFAGCSVDFDYLLPQATGQLQLLRRSVPLASAIESPDLSEDQIAKLTLIRNARTYARDVIGLDVVDSYETFYDSHGEAVAFNVSASRKDAFDPRTWRFPIVGEVPYLGFFDRADADLQIAELADDGLDVFMYEIDAYNSLGAIPNPVLSPMLKRSESSLAETVFHELLHSTVWRTNDTAFSESLATFYGRAGAIAFFENSYPDEPERVTESFQRFEDTDRYNESMLMLLDDLDVVYASEMSVEEKLATRESVHAAGIERFNEEVLPLMNRPERFAWVAGLPINNAFLLGIRRYNLEIGLFQSVFDATGRDWAVSITVFRASAASDDPYEYLRNWLGVDDTAAKRSAVAAKLSPTFAQSAKEMAPHSSCARCRSTTFIPTR